MFFWGWALVQGCLISLSPQTPPVLSKIQPFRSIFSDGSFLDRAGTFFLLEDCPDWPLQNESKNRTFQEIICFFNQVEALPQHVVNYRMSFPVTHKSALNTRYQHDEPLLSFLAPCGTAWEVVITSIEVAKPKVVCDQPWVEIMSPRDSGVPPEIWTLLWLCSHVVSNFCLLHTVAILFAFRPCSEQFIKQGVVSTP